MVSEGRLNGEKDPPEETEERKEDRNGFKTRFMFNIADGGFTGTEGWSIALLTLSKPSSANTHYTLSSGDRTTPLGVGKHIVGDPKNE